MPMILVKKNPRGKVIRELSSEEETAVKTVCGLKRPATMAQHNPANDLLREMREYDAWLQCDCIPGDSPAMNFAALKKQYGYSFICPVLIMSMHLNAPCIVSYPEMKRKHPSEQAGIPLAPV